MSDDVKITAIVAAGIVLTIGVIFGGTVAHHKVTQAEPTTSKTNIVQVWDNGKYRIEGCIPTMPCDK